MGKDRGASRMRSHQLLLTLLNESLCLLCPSIHLHIHTSNYPTLSLTNAYLHYNNFVYSHPRVIPDPRDRVRTGSREAADRQQTGSRHDLAE